MPPYSTILVTTDFSEMSLAAVEEAARLARALDSRLVLLHVVEDRVPPLLDPKTWADIMSHHEAQAAKSLDDFATKHLEGIRYETRIEVGAPHRGILDVARRLEAELIVIATQGHSRLGHALLGSTVDRVLRATSCPVLVVKPDGAEEGLSANPTS